MFCFALCSHCPHAMCCGLSTVQIVGDDNIPLALKVCLSASKTPLKEKYDSMASAIAMCEYAVEEKLGQEHVEHLMVFFKKCVWINIFPRVSRATPAPLLALAPLRALPIRKPPLVQSIKAL